MVIVKNAMIMKFFLPIIKIVICLYVQKENISKGTDHVLCARITKSHHQIVKHASKKCASRTKLLILMPHAIHVQSLLFQIIKEHFVYHLPVEIVSISNRMVSVTSVTTI